MRRQNQISLFLGFTLIVNDSRLVAMYPHHAMAPKVDDHLYCT